jgi:hypothetical protein
MGKDPDQIRQEIEDTRSQMGETVDAIGYKTDVKSRVKDSLSEKKDAIADKADGLASKVTGAVPDRDDVTRGAQRTAGLAKESPLALAIGGAAVGFLAGLLVPSTRVEDERMGSLADEVKDRAAQTGAEAVERGKVVAEEVVSSAGETMKESGKEQAEELAAVTQQSAQEVATRSQSEA